MNSLTTASPISEIDTLEQLWAIAEGYGHVGIYPDRDKATPEKYHCWIEFGTVAGTRLEAKSKFDLPLKSALREAITNAEMIRRQFK
jgi:hypothetical protein